MLFEWNEEIPHDKVKVKVEDGWVTLEGELEWNYLREAASRFGTQSYWSRRCFK